jgi:outer membrane protein insertion porin family
MEPYFMDWERIALNIDLYLKNRSYSEYRERLLGGSVGLSRHVPFIGRVGMSYGLQHVRLTDIIEDKFWHLNHRSVPYYFSQEEDDYLQGWTRLYWSYETLDKPLIPTRGTRANAAGTLYSKAFGGAMDMYELSTSAWHYVPMLYRHVLSFHFRGSIVDTFDDADQVPIGNRYFLGGGRNVRGFDYRSISPKVYPDGTTPRRGNVRSIGGQSMVLGSVEYSIPIVKNFRLGAFYDIGNVYENPYDWKWGFASSVGGGIRFDFPGFPIRLDYAVPLSRPDGYANEQRWVFWMGFD